MYNMQQHGVLAFLLGGVCLFLKHPFMKTIFGYGHTGAFKSTEVLSGLGISLLSPGLYLLGKACQCLFAHMCMYVFDSCKLMCT